jgi:antitoxin YefM
METISYTKARNKFSDLMTQVCDNHNPVIVTRQKKQSVIMISVEDYNALEETSYLLQSPRNAERLNRTINDFDQGINFKKVSL